MLIPHSLYEGFFIFSMKSIDKMILMVYTYINETVDN